MNRHLKKVLFVALIGFGLSGCAGFPGFERIDKSVLQGGLSITATVENPVTPQKLLQIQQGVDLAFTGLNTYRRLCEVDQVLPPSCVATIAKLQRYTVQVKPMLVRLRTFVRTNDQVNAIVLFNALRSLVDDIKVISATERVS